MASSGARKSPPSENESGVTLRIPMTTVRPGARRRARTDALSALRRLGAGPWVTVIGSLCAVSVGVASRAKADPAGLEPCVRKADTLGHEVPYWPMRTLESEH